jgi:Family of unknown function (DUF6279)
MITTLSPRAAMSYRLFALSVKRHIIGIGLLAVGLLAGCSAVKLGYGQGPTLAHWWLDGQVDFDSTQSKNVKEELQRWFAWHRQSQLSIYATQLEQLRAESEQPMTAERICRLSEEARDLMVPALERSLPAAAELVLSLTPAQLDRIEARYQERTDKMRSEQFPADPPSRHEAAVERAVKRYEGFYGRLTPEQRQLIDTGLRASPANAELVMERRHKRHLELMRELRAIAQERPPTALVQQRLSRLLGRFDGRTPTEPAAQARALAQFNCELTARVHNSTHPAQRQALADKLKGWETDLRALAPAATDSAKTALGSPAPR